MQCLVMKNLWRMKLKSKGDLRDKAGVLPASWAGLFRQARNEEHWSKSSILNEKILKIQKNAKGRVIIEENDLKKVREDYKLFMCRGKGEQFSKEIRKKKLPCKILSWSITQRLRKGLERGTIYEMVMDKMKAQVVEPKTVKNLMMEKRNYGSRGMYGKKRSQRRYPIMKTR
ncbi:hypothetical protein Cni_G29055 [Canna indica]|uniref:Uncharacterized protein n=1 Tax=Canna indica TaxID=4628 RepID=A0AAQ3QSW2_9LILI|nr:hypothetical protein Cni_G29055 [Canna indica]